MNTPSEPTVFSPLPADEPPLTTPEFLRPLEKEPTFVAKMRAHYETMLAQPLTPETQAMHAAAGAALRTLKHHQGAWHARDRLQEAVQRVDAALASERAQEWAKISALVEDAIDHLLDVDEPQRTELMRRATQIQEMVREFQARATP